MVRAHSAAERAVRAAAEREPWFPPGFFVWVVGRLSAAVLLVGAAALIYNCASSEQFRIRTVRVQGNVLLSQADVEDVVAANGANIFWVNRAELTARLRALPMVQSVEITPALPDALDVRIVERQPAAFWTSGDETYLVDREGVILKAVDGDTAQIRACAGQQCDPRLASMPTVAQVDAQQLTPGDRVDASALTTSAQLANLLPNVGVVPISFAWSSDLGLEVATREGWRARFDESGNLDQQVSELRAVRDQLTRAKASVQLIDVRFGDRPYYQ